MAGVFSVTQVIKLGGSLEQSRELPACLEAISRIPGGVVIVPGGGLFAEQVRTAQKLWGFDDACAHEMAVLAMRQMALLFSGIRKDFICANSVRQIQEQIKKKPRIIWSPDIGELNRAGIAAGWDVTSDSLSAWLAGRLDALQLTLLKAATFSESDIAQLAEQGIIDGAFSRFVENARFKTKIISAKDFHEQLS